MLLTIEKYFLWFILYSVIGWVYESTYCSLKEHKWINRGFLNGPICPIYGSGAIVVILILGNVEHTLSLFLSSAVLTCTLEYLTSYVMEKLFSARWWDYSDSKFNLNGRVCLAGAVAFGTFSVLLVKFLHPFVVNVTLLIPDFVCHIITAVLIVLVGTDLTITVMGMSDFNKKLKEFEKALAKRRFSGEKSLERLTANFATAKEFFREKLNYQQIRMIESFPRLKSVKHDKALLELREMMENIKRLKKH
ncbi:MAG: putative ABC transporter permease [Clostridia bacterium]